MGCLSKYIPDDNLEQVTHTSALVRMYENTRFT